MSVYTEIIEILSDKGWSSSGAHGVGQSICLGLAYQDAVWERSANEGDRDCGVVLAKNGTRLKIERVIKDLFPERAITPVSEFDFPFSCIPIFNDDPMTTWEDVVLVLKTADYLFGDEDDVQKEA